MKTYKCLKQKVTHTDLVKMNANRQIIVDTGYQIKHWFDLAPSGKAQERIDILRLQTPFDVYLKEANNVARIMLNQLGITCNSQNVSPNKKADIVLRETSLSIAQLIMLED